MLCSGLPLLFSKKKKPGLLLSTRPYFFEASKTNQRSRWRATFSMLIIASRSNMQRLSLTACIPSPWTAYIGVDGPEKTFIRSWQYLDSSSCSLVLASKSTFCIMPFLWRNKHGKAPKMYPTLLRSLCQMPMGTRDRYKTTNTNSLIIMKTKRNESAIAHSEKKRGCSLTCMRCQPSGQHPPRVLDMGPSKSQSQACTRAYHLAHVALVDA